MPATATNRKLDLLQRQRYAQLTKEEFDYFIEFCKHKRIDPWLDLLIPEVVHDKRSNRKRLRIISTIDALRLIATRTGKYRGPVGPSWCGKDGAWVDIWLNKEPPAAAMVGVRREGFSEVVWGKALFDSYCQTEEDRDGKKIPTWYWLLHGANATAKCAEALAIKRAFPEVCHDLLLREEVMRLDANGTFTPTPQPAANLPGVDVGSLGWNPMAPETSQQFQLALAFAGLQNPAAREAIIERYRQQFAEMYRQSPPVFYQTVMNAVMIDPQSHGIDPSVAA